MLKPQFMAETGWPIKPRKLIQIDTVSGSVHAGLQVYVAVIICATLVNAQTHRQKLLTGCTTSSAS